MTATNTNSDLCFSLLVCPSHDRDSKNNYLYLKLCYAFHQEIPCSEKGKFTERNFLSFFLCFPPPLFLASSGQHCLFLPPSFPCFLGSGFPPLLFGSCAWDPAQLSCPALPREHSTSHPVTPRSADHGDVLIKEVRSPCPPQELPSPVSHHLSVQLLWWDLPSSSDFWGAQEQGSSSLLSSPMISCSPATHQFYSSLDNPVLLTKVRLALSCFGSRCGGLSWLLCPVAQHTVHPRDTAPDSCPQVQMAVGSGKTHCLHSSCFLWNSALLIPPARNSACGLEDASNPSACLETNLSLTPTASWQAALYQERK